MSEVCVLLCMAGGGDKGQGQGGSGEQRLRLVA
jgi:hypothetical protein